MSRHRDKQAEVDDGSERAATYMVVAYQRAAAVCEVASVGLGLNGTDAVYFAHELREEFPEAIVAILPKK
ncbi:hypothetical protein ACIRU3_29515 [Streptomyces sp. NPDC101151]|uniref:hypothetical protein n=1 Tax=Streptomyces sp. NPDC101151 TaxID=3366115 RepID=UPI00381B7D7C